MGGYVPLVAFQQISIKGLLLLASGLYIPGYRKQVYQSKTMIEIVHGWSDDAILVESSIKLSQSCDCRLHLISGDH